MNDLMQDVRYGMRRLLQSPGFTLAVVLVLGLGIGATTAIFNVRRQNSTAGPSIELLQAGDEGQDQTSNPKT